MVRELTSNPGVVGSSVELVPTNALAANLGMADEKPTSGGDTFAIHAISRPFPI
jgi:hypothetical protein